MVAMAFADESSPVGLFLRDLALAWRNLASYPSGHPARAGSVERAHQQLQTLLRAEGEMRLGVAPDALIWQGARLESIPAQRLGSALHRRNVALLRFHPETSVADLAALLELLVADPRQTATTPLRDRLAEAGVGTIVAEGLDYSNLELAARDGEEGAKKAPSEGDLYERLLRERLAGRRPQEGAEAEALPAVLDEIQRRVAAAGVAPAHEMPPELAQLTRRLPGIVGKGLSLLVDPLRTSVAAQVAGLLPVLPTAPRHGVLEAAVRALAAVPDAGEALRALVAGQPPAVFLAVVRRLSMEGAELSDAVRALTHESAQAQRHQAAAGLPRASSSVAIREMLRTLFGDEDVDRVGRIELERSEETLFELPPTPPSPATEVAGVDDRETGFTEATLDRQFGATLLELFHRPVVRQAALAPLLVRLEEHFQRCSSPQRASEAVAILDELGKLAESAGSEPERAAIRAALKRLAVPETTARLARCVAETEAPGEALRELFVRLGAPTISPLLDALTEEKDRTRRTRLIDFTAALGPSIVPEVSRRLADPSASVMRDMLALLGAVGDRTALREVQRLAVHADPRVRLEAIKCLFGVDDKMPRQLLARAIHDPDSELASTAISLAGSRGIRQAVEPLLALLQSRDVLGRRRALRVLAIEALGRLGDPLALPPLRRFFTGGFLARVSREERRAAFASLAGYPAADRAPWVALGQRSGDAAIRSLCARLAAGDRGARRGHE
jgi:HEAT repeat protein